MGRVIFSLWLASSVWQPEKCMGGRGWGNYINPKQINVWHLLKRMWEVSGDWTDFWVPKPQAFECLIHRLRTQTGCPHSAKLVTTVPPLSSCYAFSLSFVLYYFFFLLGFILFSVSLFLKYIIILKTGRTLKYFQNIWLKNSIYWSL